jgi:photosystem II stability/assembly factor-like uncharacterized protein
MCKNLIPAVLLICVLNFSCSKSGNQPGPQNNGSSDIKIELVSGDNQTDTVGRQLQNAIVVKVTKNGVAQSGYKVLWEGSGCNEERLDEFATQANGTTSYYWWLAGDVGKQTMKVFVLDDQNKKLDSVTAVSNGLASGSGWHYSACTYPFGAVINGFCKLSTGRLFTYFIGKTYLRYSDDNGKSWISVKSLGNTHQIKTITVNSSDEIFAVANDGTYTSKDGGQTWTSYPQQEVNTKDVTGMLYTSKGKLLTSSRFNPVYISQDDGKSWTAIPITAFVPPNTSGNDGDFYDPTEDKDGNLYLIGRESQLIYKSVDEGKTWSPLISLSPIPQSPNGEHELDFSLYIDKNNWFYKYVNDAQIGGIYLSKDKGVTYNKLVGAPNAFCEEMSLQSDGNFYYYRWGGGIYHTVGISSTVKGVFGFDATIPIPYIVAKNDNIIIGSSSSNIIRYYQK